MISISQQTARRFVLGRQGLWPGRRWRGQKGVLQAVRAIEMVQMDPLHVVARSHDIVLWSRVLDYRPGHLERLLYGQRSLFEYGGHLKIYPVKDFPHLRIQMAARRRDPRWARFASRQAAVIRDVRLALRRRGPLANHDFEGSARVDSYRGRKDTALALYYLWLTGEVMIHHRDKFERVYSLASACLSAAQRRPSGRRATEAHFARKLSAFAGVIHESRWRNGMNGGLALKLSPAEARRRLEIWIKQGLLAEVRVEGWREPGFALQKDLPILRKLEQGSVPRGWTPLETTTHDEAVFLAPLDIVSARGRARELFQFDYVWEVYKPASARRWGYYTMPILIGDRLIGRFDPRLDRASGKLEILGFWLEAGLGSADLAEPLGRGLARFARFLNAGTVSVEAMRPSRLRRRTGEVVNDLLTTQARI